MITVYVYAIMMAKQVLTVLYRISITVVSAPHFILIKNQHSKSHVILYKLIDDIIVYPTTKICFADKQKCTIENR